MNHYTLVAELQERGVTFRVDGNTLLVEARRGDINLEQVEKIKANKSKIISLIRKERMRATGHGCGNCGHKIYQAVEVWEMLELSTPSPWQHEHTPITNWQCENCHSIYRIIGGSKGPQPIN